MIKAIIFDCFGVLLGSGFWHVYQVLGGDPVKDAAFIDQTLDQANLGQISQADLRSIVASHLGVSTDDLTAAYRADEVPNPPVFDLIRRELKPKYKLGILSNASTGLIESKIPPELLALFDVVVASGDVGLIKPDLAIFRLVAERLGTPPEQTVFIDDHAPFLPPAEALGMRTILYKNFADFRQQLAGLIGNEAT